MRKILLPLLASLAIATPAMANEARVEARGGVIWANGSSEDTWGIAGGYDFDLGETAFAGFEVSGDKIGATGSKVAFGGTARLGMKAGEKARVFAAGGYTTEVCDLCEGTWHAGAGAEFSITEKVYLKGEYRHFFENDVVTGSDAVVVGVGMRF